MNTPKDQKNPIYIGISSWNIPPLHSHRFERTDGSHLERYSRTFNCVEISTSFYRDHQVRSYGIWRDSVPEDFRFSVKLSRFFTHENKLALTHGRALELEKRIREIETLAEKLAVVVIQLPKTVPFDEKKTARFFKTITRATPTPFVLEARHESWISKDAQSLMESFHVTPLWTDPPELNSLFSAEEPRKTSSPLHYVRLQGSPIPRKSAYSEAKLEHFFRNFRTANGSKPLWLIFDNTKAGNAIPNAIQMQRIAKKIS